MANGFDPRSQFYRAQASQVAQKRQALTYARQRQEAEERTKIQNVNTLSGFQASQIPEGPMREIYEDRIRDAQAYMNGSGSYQGQDYSALEAANKISGLTTMFNKMSAHNMGAVADAQAAYKKGAFEVADDRERINPYGDPSGNAVYSNNSPDGYRARVQRHNNYFQWTGDYDANGDPLGYMLDDQGNPTGDPMSIFKMQGYANPSSFESDTVVEDIPALVDVAEDPVLQRRISTIASAPSTVRELTNITDPVERHNFVINKVLQNYMGEGRQDVEFRESIITQLQRDGKEYTPEQLDTFINSPLSNPELLSDILGPASAVLADLTYNAPTVSSPFRGVLEVTGRGGSVADAPYTVRTDRLADPITVSGGENLPGTSNSYTINSVGIDPTNGDILIPITYTEVEELTEDQRDAGFEAGEITRNQTLRIPAGDLNQADPLALEAFENLPAGQQALIQQGVNQRNVRSDAEIQAEMERQQQAQMDREQQSTQPPASTQAEQQAQGATAAATTQQAAGATTASQPQQEETLDIEEIPLEEENLDEGVDGRRLTPIAALPASTISLIEQANQALRDPVMSTSSNYGPAAVAAEETLRDPEATERSIERAESTLQEIVNQRDRAAAGPARREAAAFASDAEGVDPQILEQYYNNVEPNDYGFYPLPEGATISGGDVVRVNDQVVGRYESRLNPNTGRYVTGMRPMAPETQSDFSRQLGEVMTDASSAASNLARDIRDNAGMNTRRAYDAAIESLGGAGSAFLDFITGAVRGIEQAGAENRPPAPRPSGSTFVPPSPTTTITTPEAVADPSAAPEAADVVAERERLQGVEERLIEERAAERERLENIETEQTSEYIQELESLVPEMNLVSEFEGYARETPGARRANIPRGDDGKPHNNSGYTIGGLDISEHSLDDLPFLNRVIKDDDFEKIKQLEGLKGQAAQDKLNELSEAGFDANLSYLTPNDIRLIEAETYRTKILPDLKTNLEENGASVEDFKNLPLSVRDAMNSVFFLSPASGSPRTTKLLAKAMNSGEKSDWEKLVKELDRFWDRTGKTQEERVKDEDDGISRGHVRRMQTSAAQVAKQYNIPYTKS